MKILRLAFLAAALAAVVEMAHISSRPIDHQKTKQSCNTLPVQCDEPAHSTKKGS